MFVKAFLTRMLICSKIFGTQSIIRKLLHVKCFNYNFKILIINEYFYPYLYTYPVTILFQNCKMRFVKEVGTAHATVIVEDKGLSSNCWKVGEKKKM